MTENPTFGEFVKNKKFKIPDYQRAYAWEEEQLQQFVDDLLEHAENIGTNESSKYYLGHYILEKSRNSERFEIVDGQQRLTTISIFLAACAKFSSEIDLRIDLQPVTYDETAFSSIINNINKGSLANLKEEKAVIQTSSAKKMLEAAQFFCEEFENKNLKEEYCDKYVNGTACFITVQRHHLGHSLERVLLLGYLQ